MELNEFVEALTTMSETRIRGVAAAQAASAASAADQLGWWEATLTIEHTLGAAHRCRSAAMAALRASQAVVAAAGGSGLSSSDPDVVAVARAAGGIARGLVGGSAAAEATAFLLQIWDAPGAPLGGMDRSASGPDPASELSREPGRGAAPSRGAPAWRPGPAGSRRWPPAA